MNAEPPDMLELARELLELVSLSMAAARGALDVDPPVSRADVEAVLEAVRDATRALRAVTMVLEIARDAYPPTQGV